MILWIKKLRVRVIWCAFYKDTYLVSRKFAKQVFCLKIYCLSPCAKENNIPFHHIKRYFRLKKGQGIPDTWMKSFLNSSLYE